MPRNADADRPTKRSRPSRTTLADGLAHDGVDYLLAQWVDIHGTPRCKGVPASAIEAFLGGSAGFAGAATVGMGQGPHSHDLIGMPDLSTLHGRALGDRRRRAFACDITVDGEPWPYCSRTVLRRAIERLAKAGYEMRVGVEAEHMLVTRTAGRLDRRRTTRPASTPSTSPATTSRACRARPAATCAS